MDDIDGCVACDLSAGRLPLPGGLICETRRWRVEHCVGPLSLGTLLVKPTRHVARVAELSSEEGDEQGALLRCCAIVLDCLLEPEQTYIGLWSHVGREPGHIHYVVQPITAALMDSRPELGPRLQAEMFADGHMPPEEEIVVFADAARLAFAAVQ